MLNNRIDKPFFTIILPIYNVEKYLDRCINSILSQDFKDYEIILIDDGSPDNCPQICDTWEQKDKRIKTIHKQNEGLGMARNTGLENANGKYVFFIDSDDYILPGLFSEMFEYLNNKLCDIVFYGFQRTDKNDNILSKSIPNPYKDYYDKNYEIRNELLADFIAQNPRSAVETNLNVTAWNCCISREFLNENKLRFVSERRYISEDLYFYLDICEYLNRVGFIKKVYYSYCQNEGSLTYSYKPDRFERIKQFYEDSLIISDKKKYNEEIKFRLKGVFISFTIACLKMEAANYKNIGFIKSYASFKKVCSDSSLYNIVLNYPCDSLGKGWKLFSKCILQKRYLELYLLLLIKYKLKGI